MILTLPLDVKILGAVDVGVQKSTDQNIKITQVVMKTSPLWILQYLKHFDPAFPVSFLGHHSLQPFKLSPHPSFYVPELDTA